MLKTWKSGQRYDRIVTKHVGQLVPLRQHTHMRTKETLFVNTDFYLNLLLFFSLSQETHNK